jgi:hypothetical protein
VGEVETSASEASRDIEEGPGEDNDYEGRLGRLNEPSDDLEVEYRDPTGIRRARGRNERVAHECTDAEVDREVGEVRRAAQVEGERQCVKARGRTMSGIEEDRQRTSTDEDDVPGRSPHSPLTSLSE